MRTTIFSNPGLIDLRAVTTMGVNVKQDEDSAIGFFGTGFKYALATILRDGGNVSIFRGTEERYDFTCEDELIRDKLFRMVHMREQNDPVGQTTSLHFTTEMGKHWETWMAFRELYSNMLDEGGEMVTEMRPRAHTTLVVVYGDKFGAAADKRYEYFLEKMTPVWKDRDLEIYDRPSSHFFYRGVRVGSLDGSSRVTYNILSKTELTEDRTLKSIYSAEELICRALVSKVDKIDLLKKIIDTKGGRAKPWEADLSPNWRELNDEMKQAVEGLGQRSTINWLWTKYQKALPIEDRQETRAPTSFERKVLEKAQAFLELGLEIDLGKYPILISLDLGHGVMGQADLDAKVILLSVSCLRMGVKQVAGTLMEEFFHLEHGWSDCTREMQNGLIDLVITALEQKTGEPL